MLSLIIVCMYVRMYVSTSSLLPAGKEDGSVVSYDVRSSAEEVLSCQPHTKPIHRMIFVPEK